jgi:hypothetical protein
VTRKDYLTYCSVCTKRKFTHEFGFICGLTDKKADFKGDCNDFKLDKEQRQIRNKKYRDEIDSNIEKRKTIINRILDSEPQLDYLIGTESTKYQFTVNTTKEMIVMESKQKKTLLLYAIIIFPCIIGYSIYRDGIVTKNIEWFLTAFGLIWLSLIYFYRSNEEIFRLGGQGIIIRKKEFIPWHKINFVYLKTLKQEFGNAQSLILKIDDSDDKEISIEQADKDVGHITALTYQYIKECKRN